MTRTNAALLLTLAYAASLALRAEHKIRRVFRLAPRSWFA